MQKLLRLSLLTLLLFGCTATQTVEPTAEPPTDTPVPTATVAPTDTHTPAPTAIPTETVEPATSTPTAEPTDTPRPAQTPTPVVARFPVEGKFTIYGDTPAVPNDNLGPSGQQFTDPGGVIFHDGKFHMLHNAFTGWPAPVDIMYSVSDDGLNWELAQEEPVFEGDEVDYAEVALLASSIIVFDDGTWGMYFYTWDDRTWPVSRSSIGLATAPGPQGPWTPLEEPILTAGADGEWDDLAVRVPSVVQTADGYVMFYSGYQRNLASIGRATSEDGISWVKHNDPATDAPYADSDPIFSGSGAGWDRVNVYQSRVRQTEAGWTMLYSSANQVGGNSLFQEHGLAFSQDGVDWIRSETKVFQSNEVNSRGRNIWFTELVYALDRFFIYLELGTGGETEIYVAEFDSDLLPD